MLTFNAGVSFILALVIKIPKDSDMFISYSLITVKAAKAQEKSKKSFTRYVNKSSPLHVSSPTARICNVKSPGGFVSAQKLIG